MGWLPGWTVWVVMGALCCYFPRIESKAVLSSVLSLEDPNDPTLAPHRRVTRSCTHGKIIELAVYACGHQRRRRTSMSLTDMTEKSTPVRKVKRERKQFGKNDLDTHPSPWSLNSEEDEELWEGFHLEELDREVNRIPNQYESRHSEMSRRSPSRFALVEKCCSKAGCTKKDFYMLC